MKLTPTEQQFKKWSLPSKASYIGLVLTVIALVLGVISFIFQIFGGASIEGQDIIHDKLDRNYAASENAPYIRFAKKIKIIKQKPNLGIINEIIRDVFQNNPINGEKIITRIQSLPDNVKSQFINIFYTTSLVVQLENIGGSLARDIKVFFHNDIIYQTESLASNGELSDPVTMHEIRIAGDGWEDHDKKAIQYKKTPEMWNSLIDLLINIVNEGGKIGNALEDRYNTTATLERLTS